MNIFVVGDVMLDIDLRGRFRENYEEATHCITGQRWRYYPGGAANVAAVLRWLAVFIVVLPLHFDHRKEGASVMKGLAGCVKKTKKEN